MSGPAPVAPKNDPVLSDFKYANELGSYSVIQSVASPGDEGAYIAAALALLADRTRLAELSQAGRQTMLPRNWAGVVASFEKVAREAIAG